MKIDTLLIDMDGVVVDFVRAACAALNDFNGDFSIDDGQVVRDWDSAHYSLERQLGISTDSLWEAIDWQGELFWKYMPTYPWTDALLGWLSDSGLRWYFCTTPSRSGASASGKVQWMQRTMGTRFRDYIITPHKHLVAAPNRLLLDDREQTVAAFKKRRCPVVMFPQPWNSLGLVADPLSGVLTQMQRLIDGPIGADA